MQGSTIGTLVAPRFSPDFPDELRPRVDDGERFLLRRVAGTAPALLVKVFIALNSGPKDELRVSRVTAIHNLSANMVIDWSGGRIGAEDGRTWPRAPIAYRPMLRYLESLGNGALGTAEGLRAAKAGWAAQRAEEKRAELELREAEMHEKEALLRAMSAKLSRQVTLTEQQEKALAEAEDEALAKLRAMGQEVPAGLVGGGGDGYYLPLKHDSACVCFDAGSMPSADEIDTMLRRQLREGPYELHRIAASYTGISCLLSRRCG